MAQKDITEKILEAYNDVFADIVNVLLFQGSPVIKPEELVDQAPRSAYKADGVVREIERDVAKRWMKQNIRIACVGLENQTQADPDMPLRVLAYDGAEYRSQLNGRERYPVVTLVLYFGHERHWEKPLNLLGCLNVPPVFQPYVNDYRINLFEIAFLEEETVKLFQSDFGIVADYFVQKRKYGDYRPSETTICHVQEVLQLLSVMTKDHRFEEVLDRKSEGGTSSMCEIIDKFERRGYLRGEAIGLSKGEAIGLSKGEAIGLSKGEAIGLSKGEAIGLSKGEDSIRLLMKRLFDAGRYEEAQRAVTDRAYCNTLLAEFGLR